MDFIIIGVLFGQFCHQNGRRFCGVQCTSAKQFDSHLPIHSETYWSASFTQVGSRLFFNFLNIMMIRADLADGVHGQAAIGFTYCLELHVRSRANFVLIE